MDKQILFIKGNDDQETIAKILFKNGYTVRPTTVLPKNSKTKVKVIEYWKEEQICLRELQEK